MIYLTHTLQKVCSLQLVNQTKCIKKPVINCDVTGGITLATKLKIPIFTFYSPHNLQSKIFVFQKFMYQGYGFKENFPKFPWQKAGHTRK